MECIVIDSNVLVSAAILPVSTSARALLVAVKKFQMVQSGDTWVEFCEVISRKKFDRYFNGNDRNAFMLSIARASNFVPVTASVTDCSDPKDNKFLELALSASAPAPIILSGDAHLLDMHPYRGITICNPQYFLERSLQ